MPKYTTILRPTQSDRDAFALHVFTPLLMKQIKEGTKFPLNAVRLGSNGYTSLILVDSIQILGPSELRDISHEPLPGTNGRAVCVLFTNSPVKIVSNINIRANIEKYIIDCSEPKTIEEVTEQVLRVYA